MESWLWTQKQDIGPGPRYGSSMAYDSSLKRVILFGGNTDTLKTMNDTWEWKENTWIQIADSGPSARLFHAMEYDSSRNKVFLFGGSGESGEYQSDTWQLEGTEWTQIADTGPSGRAFHSLAYDTDKKKIILFGGAAYVNDNTVRFGDTWEWDGSEWTQIADSGPSPRSSHSMTYDSANHVVVLFGGQSDNNPPSFNLGDTWVMSNNIWKKVQDIGPGLKSSSAMVYADTRTVLFGGQLYSTFDGTTWEWNGTNWMQRQNMGPSPRGGHSMAYDSERKRVVLFGGNSAQILGDTWELKIVTIPE